MLFPKVRRRKEETVLETGKEDSLSLQVSTAERVKEMGMAVGKERGELKQLPSSPQFSS